MWGNSEQVVGHRAIARECRMRFEFDRMVTGRRIGWFLGGVRDPIAMAISGFFQGYDYWAGKRDSITADFVVESVMNFPPLKDTKGFFRAGLDGWCDNEYKETLGIDVFETPFPTEVGFATYQNEGVRLMLVRQENFDKLPEALEKFYDIPRNYFGVVDANRSEQKPFIEEYRIIRKEIQFPDSFLDEVYSGCYARHFYSTEEIEQFRARWGGG